MKNNTNRKLFGDPCFQEVAKLGSSNNVLFVYLCRIQFFNMDQNKHNKKVFVDPSFPSYGEPWK
jgi:hypothetical protein